MARVSWYGRTSDRVDAVFVLIHSPLVGPTTWTLVGEELRARGRAAVTPELHDALCNDGPYWSRHVAAVSSAVDGIPRDRPVVLVAHSGAGPLLPAIGARVERAVAAYVFVDAALPGTDGQSRLDLFGGNEAKRFRGAAIDGMIPPVWRNETLLRELGIEDTELRRRFVAEVPDVPLAVYEEPLPVPADWPGAPCGYLLLSQPYAADAREASARQWAYRELLGGHFQMLVEPVAVAEALLDLVDEMGA
jgi:hypothetical protein